MIQYGVQNFSFNARNKCLTAKLLKQGYSLLTVPRRLFCCGSLLSFFGVRVSVTFHLTCAHIILVRFRLLSGHLLGNSCSFN